MIQALGKLVLGDSVGLVVATKVTPSCFRGIPNPPGGPGYACYVVLVSDF